MTTRARIRPPVGPCDATVVVPGSKSIANRALVCAMLASGPTRLENLPMGDDTEALLGVLDAAGVLGRPAPGAASIVSGALDRVPARIDSRLAGTTSRFMTAVAALSGGEHVIDGEPALRTRPMGPLHVALRALGAELTELGEPERLPVKVGGTGLAGNRVTVDGGTSSQFISALMLIGPCLPRGLTIELTGAVVSRSYIGMTAAVMRRFGASLQCGDTLIDIAPTGYRGTDLRIEADFSSAAFPICGLLLRGGEIRLPGLPSSSIQGDARMLELAVRMGAEVLSDGDTTVVRRVPGMRPHGIDIDLADESDLVPALSVVCAIAEGPSRLSGIGFIRGKESDRLAVMDSELSRLGARVRVTADGLEFEGVGSLVPGTVDTHDDHRVAMSLALAALSAGEVEILDPNVVSKSWPHFFTDMAPVLGHASIEE